MDPLRTCGSELNCLSDGIVVVDGFSRIVTLIQANGVTIEQIDCGKEFHQAPTFARAESTKPRRSSSPTVPDFSG